MTKNKGHTRCINMRISPADLARLEEEREHTHDTTSTVISSAIERGFNLSVSGGKKVENENK